MSRAIAATSTESTGAVYPSTVAPLLVQFEYHPYSKEAASTAGFLHSALNDDPAVPGLRIPTRFVPDDGTGEPPEPVLATDAARVVVVLLADDQLAATARKPTRSGIKWCDYAVGLRERCDASPAEHRFFPVQLTEHAYPIDRRLEDLSFLRAWTVSDVDSRHRLIARRLIHLLLRRLTCQPGSDDAPALTIFLSHTKLDLDREPRAVKALLSHLTASQPEKTWFDSGDIASGSRFAREIERGVRDAALLAVVTDSYSSRAWCRREILLAKHHQRPVVVVDALQEREVRSFPYVGNVPVLRWRDDPQEAVDLLVREALRHAHADELLKLRRRPDEDMLPAGPELLTLIHRPKGRSVLYPDPPLGIEELALLDATGVRIETPLQRYARENRLDDRGLTVALSVSEAEDIARYGLRRAHLDAALLELSRYLLLSGVRLAYGGYLRPDGYTVRLADLLYDPIVEQLRGTSTNGARGGQQLVCHVPWPMFATIHDQARLGPLAEIHHCPRPPDVDDSLDPLLLPVPQVEIPADTPARRYAWARGLTDMRERQLRETTARIAIGGRIGSVDAPYKGRMPGVLEEAFLAIEAERPIYLIGAYGGSTRLVIDALEGRRRDELTWDYHRKMPHSEAVRDLYRRRGQQWVEIDDVADRLRARGMDGLRNGLTAEENRELANTRSTERMIELILRGLRGLGPTDDVDTSDGEAP